MSEKSSQSKSISDLNKRKTNDFRWPLDGYSEYLDEAVHPQDRANAFEEYVLKTSGFPDCKEMQLSDHEYKIWLTKPAFNKHEFVCLLLGRDPVKFDWQFAKYYVDVNHTARQYAFLIEQVNQSTFRDCEYINFEPGLEWAKKVVTCLPAQLLSAKREKQETSQYNKALNPKERNALYRIVLGMAISQYNYKPRTREGTQKHILEDLESANCLVSKDTLSKHLRGATDEILDANFDDD